MDVYTGLNAMILLLELHRHAQDQENLKDTLVFYPSGHLAEGATQEYTDRLLKVIHSSDAIALSTFTSIAGAFLSRANLSSATLGNADLTNADLTNANLENITWDKNTKWDGVKGLETATNVPQALRVQLGI